MCACVRVTVMEFQLRYSRPMYVYTYIITVISTDTHALWQWFPIQISCYEKAMLRSVSQSRPTPMKCSDTGCFYPSVWKSMACVSGESLFHTISQGIDVFEWTNEKVICGNNRQKWDMSNFPDGNPICFALL